MYNDYRAATTDLKLVPTPSRFTRGSALGSSPDQNNPAPNIIERGRNCTHYELPSQSE